MSKLSKDKVREIFMAYGFTIKEGQDDLKEYVYAAAQALAEAAVAAAREEQEPVAWMHDQPSRVDVISKPVKELLERQYAAYPRIDHESGLIRRTDKVEHYTIPLYTTPPAVPVPDEIGTDDAPCYHGHTESLAYADGWNDCRLAMLALQNNA